MAKKNEKNTEFITEEKSSVKISIKQFIDDFAELSIPHNIMKEGFLAFLKFKKSINERKTFEEWKTYFKNFLSEKMS